MLSPCFTVAYTPQLAKLVLSEAGIAKIISVNNKNMRVYAQAAHLNALQPNDEVLFVATEQGPYVIARSLRSSEKPTINFANANIFITAAGDIHLQTKKASLTLTATGVVKMSGQTILQQSDGDINFSAGENIHLNPAQI